MPDILAEMLDLPFSAFSQSQFDFRFVSGAMYKPSCGFADIAVGEFDPFRQPFKCGCGNHALNFCQVDFWYLETGMSQSVSEFTIVTIAV